MRDPDLAILSVQSRERTQALIRDSNDFRGSSCWSVCEVRGNDVKNGGLGYARMTRHGTARLEVSLRRIASIGDVLRPIHVPDVVPLDSRYVPSRCQPSERKKPMIRQCNEVAVPVEQYWPISLVYRHAWHQQQRLHVHCAMEVKNLSELPLDDTVKYGVLRRVSCVIVEDWLRGLRINWLGKKRRQDSR